jgi:methylase of polypeptide subunit release factors
MNDRAYPVVPLRLRGETESDPAASFVWQCPVCRSPLSPPSSGTACPTCAERFPTIDGIHRFLSSGREEGFTSFLEGYARVRSAEGWGSTDPGYYRSLPEVTPRDRSAKIWRVRQLSFRVFLDQVVRPLERATGRGLVALDLGAGNGWLSHRLAKRGHAVAAVDITVDDRDGLGAIKHFRGAWNREAGPEFIAVQADYDRLPFRSEQVDLVVFNGSFHHSPDYETTIGEARRVLRPGGLLVVLDTPFYSMAAAGVAMLRERDADFRQSYGINPSGRPAEAFLDRDRWNALRETTGLSWRKIDAVGPIRGTIRRVATKLRGQREPAAFPVLVGRRVGQSHLDSRMARSASPIRVAIARFGLRWQFRLFLGWRLHRTVTETIAGRRLTIVPSVFNPVLFRSGKFLGESLSATRVPPGSAVLDLGTGSGIGALVASAWADRVVAVDLNPHAVRCAQMNADRLQPGGKIEVREGDLFDPVPGERFDVVLFNPPFYRGTPRDEFDLAWHSTDIVERFSAQFGDHLNPRGRGFVLLSTDGETAAFVQSLSEHGWRVRPVSIRHYANESFTLYRLSRVSEESDDRSL